MSVHAELRCDRRDCTATIPLQGLRLPRTLPEGWRAMRRSQGPDNSDRLRWWEHYCPEHRY